MSCFNAVSGFHSPPSLFHNSFRNEAGQQTESIPSKLTPRKIYGCTEVSNLPPPVSPDKAMAPPYFIDLTISPVAAPPTGSTTAAQFSLDKAPRLTWEASSLLMTVVAPNAFSFSSASDFPVEATTSNPNHCRVVDKTDIGLAVCHQRHHFG